MCGEKKSEDLFTCGTCACEWEKKEDIRLCGVCKKEDVCKDCYQDIWELFCDAGVYSKITNGFLQYETKMGVDIRKYERICDSCAATLLRYFDGIKDRLYAEMHEVMTSIHSEKC